MGAIRYKVMLREPEAGIEGGLVKSVMCFFKMKKVLISHLFVLQACQF